eukprot:Colp12_sorted_trinity150504_noHs@22417
MGSSHGGAGDGVGGRGVADPHGLDVSAGGEDVDARAVAGEAGTGIVLVGGADSDGLRGSSGGRLAGISVGEGVVAVVAGGDSHGETTLHGSRDGIIHSLVLATTEGHATNGGLASGLGVVSGPLDTLNNPVNGARATSVEDLDGNSVSLLGNTVGGAEDGASAVGAVAVVVSGCAASGVNAPGGTALDLVVLEVDASVDHINVDTLASVVGVDVRTLELVVTESGTLKTPLSASLLDAGVIGDDDLVGLNVGNGALHGEELVEHLSGHTDGVTLEGLDLESVLEGGVVGLGEALDLRHVDSHAEEGGLGMEDDKVLVLHNVGRLSVLEGHKGRCAQQHSCKQEGLRQDRHFTTSKTQVPMYSALIP